MGFVNQNRVGNVGPFSTGSVIDGRSDSTGCQVVTQGHGRLQEAVLRGNVYLSANQTGVTTQAGLSATTPALTLYNPLGNNKNLILLYAGCVNSVAFAAASVIWIGANTNLAASAVTGTAATVRNAMLGNANSPSAFAYTSATLPTAPIAVATLGVGLTGAITTIPALPTYGRFFEGEIILMPGAAVSFQTSTASGTSGFFGEFVWEEVSI